MRAQRVKDRTPCPFLIDQPLVGLSVSCRTTAGAYTRRLLIKPPVSDFLCFLLFDRVRSTEYLRIIPNGTTDQALGPVSLEPE